MECPFQVGDPIICIEELTDYEKVLYRQHGPVLDEIYHVREMHEGACLHCGETHIYIHLAEIIVADQGLGEPGFNHILFRKAITPEEFMSKDVGLPVDSVEKVPEHV